MRRCISEPTTRFPRPAPRSVATSASTTPSALIRALTGKRQTMLTSVACSRSRQPEPGRGATYLNRNAVQTNRATAKEWERRKDLRCAHCRRSHRADGCQTTDRGGSRFHLPAGLLWLPTEEIGSGRRGGHARAVLEV